MKILMIGPLPPPLGGVSVFVKRHKRELETAGHRVEVLDPGKLTRLQYLVSLLLTPLRSYNLISVNVASPYVLIILFMLGLVSRTQVIDHNWRQLETWNRTTLRFFNFFVNRGKEMVLIAPHLKFYYQQHGVSLPASTRVQHPFIPPPFEEAAAIVATYPPDACEFITRKRPLLIANAFRIIFYKGVDLYGLDMCVDLIASLRKEHPEIGLLFALAEVGDADYFAEINRRINELGINHNIHFMGGQREIWPLFKKADLMIRPTYTDGFGISVAEALYFDCPAVASDVCERPAGAVTFANRNREDFLLKCREALLRKSSRGATEK